MLFRSYALVNYTIRGDYMVAQRVLEAGVLKLGKAEIRFKRKVQKPESSAPATGIN